MIDLRTVACAPLEVETLSEYVVGSETQCPDPWSGMSVSSAQAYRVHRLRWKNASRTDWAAFRVVLADTAGGHAKVVVTPPTDPAGLALSPPRASQQGTIVGRLRGPFSLRQDGHARMVIEADLVEDL